MTADDDFACEINRELAFRTEEAVTRNRRDMEEVARNVDLHSEDAVLHFNDRAALHRQHGEQLELGVVDRDSEVAATDAEIVVVNKAEGRATLSAVYDWFTEGFDTLDLTTAKTLLAELE